jgi:hypothetical protein
MQRRGDINVLRLGIFGLRANEGLNTESLTSNKALDKYAHKTHSLNPNGANRTITLPDATTLSLGWEVVIHHFGSANSLLVQNFGGILQKEIKVITPANESRIYSFQVIDITTNNGVWVVKEVGLSGEDSADTSYKITTTDNTPTTIALIPIQTNIIKNLEIKVSGKKESGTGNGAIGDGVAFVRHARLKNISNVVTLHHLQSTFTSKDVNQWNILIDVVGTNLRVRVQGSSNNTIAWKFAFFEQNI